MLFAFLVCLFFKVRVGREFVNHLMVRLEEALARQPIDVDYVEFICRSDLAVMESLAQHIHFPDEVV